ncbi:hypothetical protein LOTGIDRAFT_164981 [Lottia gigantea]|uniref:Uncharacterized protein n=1 Tax=Lottia gigantea TaxID=225164 RepID=V3ZEV1_LOTGI|nr:hypothetical protein LOTGIDRAFT_164981 [Lottia gigantea]ESO89678.1 hypothetical protein LOTGIDRAFT_164981 [Lottia gigantea]
MYITTKTLPMKGSPEAAIMRPVSIPIFIEKQWEQIRVNIPPPPSLDNPDTPCSWRERKKRIDDALSWLRTELSNLKIQDQQILGQFRRCQDTIDNLKSQKTLPWSDWDMTSEDDLEEDEGHWEDWEIKEFEQEFDKNNKDCKEKKCLDLETSFEKRQHSPSLSSSSSHLSDKHSRYFHHKYSESESSSTSGHSSLIRQDVERRKRPTRHTVGSATAEFLRQSPELAKRILTTESGIYTSRLRLGINPPPVTMTPVRVSPASMTQSITSPNITSATSDDLRVTSSPSSSWVYSTIRRPTKDRPTASGLTSPTSHSERTFSPVSVLSSPPFSPSPTSISSTPFSPTPSEPCLPRPYTNNHVPYSPTSSEPFHLPSYTTQQYSPRSAPIINKTGAFTSPLHPPPPYWHSTRTPNQSGMSTVRSPITSFVQNHTSFPTHRVPHSYSQRSAPVKLSQSSILRDRNPFTFPPPVYTDL